MPFEIVPQDEAWAKQARENLTAFYEQRQMKRMPFEFVAYDIRDEYKPRDTAAIGRAPVKTVADARREFFDVELQLQNQLAAVAKRVRAGFWDDTVLAIHPIGGATGWLTEVFGGETVWFAHRPPYPHHVIHETSQIDRLRPDFQASPIFQAGLEQMRFFRKVVGDRIPVGPPDLQSPIDVATMIFDYTQLIYAMVDEPAKVHALMRMITEAMIEACHVFAKETNDYALSAFNWWLPRGIFLSDDLQAVLNPDLYREFAVPYNEMLAREFGGLALHSCGRTRHNFENLATTQGLLGFNTHETLNEVAAAIQDRTAVILGGVAEVIAPNHPECKRPHIASAEALEEFWWTDFEKLSSIKGQRVLYQCHALLCRRSAREAYERMLTFSQEMVPCPGRRPEPQR